MESPNQDRGIDDVEDALFGDNVLDEAAAEYSSPDTKTTKRKSRLSKRKSTKGRRSSLRTALRSKSLELVASPKPPSPNRLASSSVGNVKALSSSSLSVSNKKESLEKKTLSSDDLVLAKVNEEKRKEKEKILKARRMYERLKAKGFKPKAKEVVKPKPTIPKAPKSMLEKRLGSKVPSVLKKSPSKAVLESSASNALVAPKAACPTSPRLTIPVPFHFATESRIRSSTPTATSLRASLTAGELAQKFFQDPRSHYVPEQAAKTLTQPHSPVFHTKQRSTSASKERPPSYEERLEQEMREMLKHSFKARPLDRRIFESNGELGVPKVEAKPLTVPQEFHLALEKRATETKERHAAGSQSRDEHVVAPTPFKALPMPDFSQPPSSPHGPRTTFQPTVPVSPKLHGTRASSAPPRRQRPHHAEVEKRKAEEAESWKKQASNSTRVTIPKEFHLLTSDRGEAYQQIFEEYLRQEQEMAQQHQFKAQPVRGNSAFVPKPSSKPTTEPVPFQLHAPTGTKSTQPSENAQEEHAASFRARPVPKTTYTPQVVDKHRAGESENQPPITMPLNVVLNSTVRAQQRQQFDVKVASKQQEQKQLQMQSERAKQLQEEREIVEKRKKSIAEGGMAFKAQPVLKKDVFATKHVPAKEATVPVSPKLRLKERRVQSLGGDGAKKQSRAATPVGRATGREKKSLPLPR